MKLIGTCEVALSKEDLAYAVLLWLEKSSIAEYAVVGVTLHPGNKYVVRATVGPPHTKRPKSAAAEPHAPEISAPKL